MADTQKLINQYLEAVVNQARTDAIGYLAAVCTVCGARPHGSAWPRCVECKQPMCPYCIDNKGMCRACDEMLTPPVIDD